MGIDVRDIDQPVGTLSGGERQSVAIARAVYFGARVLILDEPTSALGVKQSGVVLKYTRAAADRGLGVIFITHNPNHAFPVGDRFLVLNRGHSLGDFAKDEISPHRAHPSDGRRCRAGAAGARDRYPLSLDDQRPPARSSSSRSAVSASICTPTRPAPASSTRRRSPSRSAARRPTWPSPRPASAIAQRCSPRSVTIRSGTTCATSSTCSASTPATWSPIRRCRRRWPSRRWIRRRIRSS